MTDLSSLEARHRMARWSIIICVLIFICAYLIPLDWRPMVVPDEARYAAIPAEMIETGEWVVPHLVGFRYFEKPVLGYWLTGGAFLAFGENVFSLRLPSALATGFGAFMLMLLVRRWTGRWDHAALAAGVMLTTLICIILGTTAVLDAPFAGFVTATVACFYLAVRAQGGQRVAWLIAAGAACGLAFMVKGFLAGVLPAIVLGPWLVWERRWRELFLLPWIPAIVAVLVVLPWGIAVHMRSPDYWHYFFWTEHIHRFTGGQRAQHPEPWWFFFPIILVSLIPWVFALPMAIGGVLRRGVSFLEGRLLVCWLVMPLLFFSASSGKLPTYILPCIPPAAALIAIGLIEWFGHRTPRGLVRERVPGLVLIVLGVAGLIGAVFLPEDPADGGIWQDGGTWRLGVMGLTMIWWGLVDWYAQSVRSGERRVFVGMLAPAAMMIVMPSLMPTGWMTVSKSPQDWLAQFDDLASRSKVLAGRDLVHAARWAWPETELALYGQPGELRWAVEKFEDHAPRWIEQDELVEEVTLATADQPVILLVTMPEARLDDITALVEAGEIESPTVVQDRDILLAAWPATTTLTSP